MVPASHLTIARYIAYLSTKLGYSSIKQYINIIRLLHLESGLPNPLTDFHIQQVLKGVKRVKGDAVHRRPVMTVQILRQMRNIVNISVLDDCTFWATCLLAFYGMLRMSSIFPPAPHRLTLASLRLHAWGIVVRFQYSKTVQYGQRQPYICLPWGQEARLCPVRAMIQALLLAGTTHPRQPVLAVRLKGAIVPYTKSMFFARLKSVMHTIGLHGYSGHSFRRGGATHALHSGVPAEIIKAQGDWRSLAYLQYIDSKSASKRAGHLSAML